MTNDESMTNDEASPRGIRHSRFVIISSFVIRASSFLLALLLFLLSLLTLGSAPTGALWVLSIIVAEWGVFVALLALGVAAFSWQRARLTMSLALTAAILSLLPAVRAAWMSRSLPARCDRAFGPATERAAPFSWPALFFGVATAGVEVTEHVYATEGKKELKLDLYRAQRSTEPSALIVTIHGGAWNTGSKEQAPAINYYLARQGYAVAAINYRHAPKFPFPAAVEDTFRALEFLKTHAAEFQLDPNRIVLFGRSAGAQLALAAGYAGREPGIRGVIDLYGPADLVLGYEKPSRRWVLDSKKVLEEYLGGAPSEKPEAYAAASPVNFVNENTPPTLLIHGQLDPIVWPAQSEVLAARLQAAGRPHLHLALPWATHGCDANLHGPSGQLSRYTIDRFLAHVLAKRAAN